MAKTIGAQVKEIVQKISIEVGWCKDLWYHNDKLKQLRRLKFYMNGWEVPETMKQEMIDKVTKELNDNNIPFIKVEWIVSRSYRGPYDKFIVEVNH